MLQVKIDIYHSNKMILLKILPRISDTFVPSRKRARGEAINRRAGSQTSATHDKLISFIYFKLTEKQKAQR